MIRALRLLVDVARFLAGASCDAHARHRNAPERCRVDDHLFRVTHECEVCGITRPPGNTQGRYLAERRECARRGVPVGNLNDVVFDDLAEEYGSTAAAVEALCADPRPRRVEHLAGPRFTTAGVERT